MWCTSFAYVLVYRSPVVRDTDDIYKQVMTMTAGAELLLRQTIPDEGMMFGEAELSVYKVNSPDMEDQQKAA